MSELQTSFALGTNISSDGVEYGNRTIEYANAGKPVTVVFEKNKAVSVTPVKAQ
jgi:formylmethanofuran dehydrogenase subunit E